MLSRVIPKRVASLLYSSRVPGLVVVWLIACLLYVILAKPKICVLSVARMMPSSVRDFCVEGLKSVYSFPRVLV